MTAHEVFTRSLTCDADCPAVFGPLDMANFRQLRREARRQGWAYRWITWHGQPKLADLCPADAGIREVLTPFLSDPGDRTVP